MKALEMSFRTHISVIFRRIYMYFSREFNQSIVLQRKTGFQFKKGRRPCQTMRQKENAFS